MDIERQSNKQIFERIESVLKKRTGSLDNKLALDMTLNDLGLDSFATVEMVFALEEEFGVEIPGEGLRNVSTVKDLVMVCSDAVNTCAR